jgi:hypothetical protein
MNFLRRPLHLLRELALAIVFLVASYCVPPLQGQQPTPRIQATVLRTPPPESADSAWQYVLRCSHAKVQPGGDLKDVKWFIADLLSHSRDSTIGLWLPPDTIVLDLTVSQDPDIVAHELLHHLLRGPPHDAHPMVPFLFPCQLINPDYYNRDSILKEQM